MSRILIVDDEPSISWGLSRLARSMGHEVDVAPSAEEGLCLADGQSAGRADPRRALAGHGRPHGDGIVPAGARSRSDYRDHRVWRPRRRDGCDQQGGVRIRGEAIRRGGDSRGDRAGAARGIRAKSAGSNEGNGWHGRPHAADAERVQEDCARRKLRCVGSAARRERRGERIDGRHNSSQQRAASWPVRGRQLRRARSECDGEGAVWDREQR